MIFWPALCAAGLLVTLAGEYRENLLATASGKVLAAAAYVGFAVSLGAQNAPWGSALLAGMCCCWAGDLLLVSRRSRRLFVAGLAAFLLGHLVYSLAFLLRGQSVVIFGAALVVMAIFSLVVMKWLRPHLELRMRIPVFCYVIAISLMWATALGSAAALASPPLVAGATLFVLSDLAVARNRFVSVGFRNRAWGLPAYFSAQLLLGWSLVY